MLDLTESWFGYLALAIFVIAYVLVIFEETTQLRKSKPVLMAAGLIWALIGMAYAAAGMGEQAEAAAQHVIMEYGELFLFLLVAITYVNTLEERRVFDVLRVKLTSRNLSYRKLFWLTGIVGIFPFERSRQSDDSLIMGAVVLAIGKEFDQIYCHLLHQHRGGGQCGRRLLALRRHHNADGLAEGQARRSSNSLCSSFHRWSIGWCLPLFMQFAIPHETPAASTETVRA